MRRSPIVVGALVLIALAIVTVTLVLPRGARVAELRSQIDGENATLEQLRASVAELRAASEDETVLADLRDAISAVPPSADLSGLLARVAAAATKAGVRLERIEPGQPSSVAGASAIPVSIGVAGSFFELARFLFELEHMERLMKVSSVNLQATDAGIALGLTGEVYTTDASAGPGSAAA